ncbi:tungstate transport system substrate-binding protein [Symbiobacterium terraclitae]|uniref:Tungstate transport system substrate-binding protein n=1 Tax=Symbiobacterium terraclitae TaxID=557451 RepID=A0ABS4JUD7_9FIRM|nr:substrate-binding domain-containing protein [Symbiobacterium terraclitae]MBP2019166.1 tungstate transport system substrate-binding protein [Symbiobacterium terraclitae]
MTTDYRRLLDGDDQFERLCAILAAVSESGSLRKATEALGYSYRYAWGLIRRAEEEIGTPLLIRKVGGASGGGAELTSAARDLLRRYRLLTRETQSIMGPSPILAPESRPLLMSSTIGPVEVGLVDALVAAYRRETGNWVRYIAAGSGQALELARAGRVDLVLVHAPDLEEQFLAEGFGTGRYPLAWDTFVICGPVADPAGVRTAPSAADAMRRIAEGGFPFVSRNDRSGTNMRELALWEAAGIAPSGPWYQPWPLGGQGNIATIRHAAATGAYTLTDSATLARACPEGFTGLFSDDPILVNRFNLIPVNPDLFPAVNHQGAKHFCEWATGPGGRRVVESFGTEAFGTPLFHVP